MFKGFFALPLLTVLAGCMVVPTSAPISPAVPTAETDVRDDYRLGVADKLRILVYNEAELSGQFLVNANGAVAFPLIGEVQASGRTLGEVTTEIQARLADGYLREPKVAIDLIEFRPFYILGEVNKPGEYPYSAGLTVMEAIAKAEGFTYRANTRTVSIKSAGQASERVTALNSSTPLGAGDTILIFERHF